MNIALVLLVLQTYVADRELFAEANETCNAAIEQARHPHLRELRKVPGAAATCLRVAYTAGKIGLPMPAAVASAAHETRMRDVPCKKGQWRMETKGVDRYDLPAWCEQGPTQAKPKYHCPEGKASEDCDYLGNSLRFLAKMKQKHETWSVAFGAYKLPSRPDMSYGSNVRGKMRSIEAAMRLQEQKRRLTWKAHRGPSSQSIAQYVGRTPN